MYSLSQSTLYIHQTFIQPHTSANHPPIHQCACNCTNTGVAFNVLFILFICTSNAIVFVSLAIKSHFTLLKFSFVQRFLTDIRNCVHTPLQASTKLHPYAEAPAPPALLLQQSSPLYSLLVVFVFVSPFDAPFCMRLFKAKILCLFFFSFCALLSSLGCRCAPLVGSCLLPVVWWWCACSIRCLLGNLSFIKSAKLFQEKYQQTILVLTIQTVDNDGVTAADVVVNASVLFYLFDGDCYAVHHVDVALGRVGRVGGAGGIVEIVIVVVGFCAHFADAVGSFDCI